MAAWGLHLAAQELHMAAQGLHMAAQGLHMVAQGLHMAAQGPGWPQESPGAEVTCPLGGRMVIPGLYHQPNSLDGSSNDTYCNLPSCKLQCYILQDCNIRDCKDFEDA